jgi:cytochrome c553
MKRKLAKLSMLLLAVGLAGALVVISGVVPLEASAGHWSISERFLQFAKQRSVSTYSLGRKPPESLDNRRLIIAGAGHYEDGCRPCHASPGIRQPIVTSHMLPRPPRLSERVKRYDDAELFTIIRHGLKFTGMPAWPAETRDDEVWSVVAFVRLLPTLSPAAYERLVHGDTHNNASGDAPAVVAELCARCHGGNGLGRSEGAFPRLANQRPAYLRSALEAYSSGARTSGIMRPIAATLGPEELAVIVDWYSKQPAPRIEPAPVHLPGRAIAFEGVPERRVPPCSRCHGPENDRPHPAYPRLAGQFAAYLEQQLQLFSKRARGGGKYADVMEEVVTDHELEPDQIQAVARYYATLRPDSD